MIDNCISVLKDDAKITNLCFCLFIALFILLFLKAVLKSAKINPVFFNGLILVLLILMFALGLGNVLMTENYSRLWNLVFVAIVIILQNAIPKFVKWYDNKVDKLSGKI